MSNHDVKFEVPSRPLGRADVKFVVKRNSGVLGTLTISNGSLVWFPKKVTNGCKMSWKQFDQLMQGHSQKTERR